MDILITAVLLVVLFALARMPEAWLGNPRPTPKSEERAPNGHDGHCACLNCAWNKMV